MVNIRNLSAHEGLPPSDPQQDRNIKGGPLYSVANVQSVLAMQQIDMWTRKAVADAQTLKLDEQQVADLISEAITHGNYRGSEWCEQSGNGAWAACDCYVVHKAEWIAAARREMLIEYYLKFALGQRGLVVLVISCHLSGERH